MKIVGAPEGPFLAILTSTDGTVQAFPRGCTIFNVEDATRPDKITPMILVKTSLKKLTFRCGCGDGKCTRVMEYHLKAKGHHPPKFLGQNG